MWHWKSAVLARGLQMTPPVLSFGGNPFPPSLLRQRRFLLSRVLPHPALPARGSWHSAASPPPLDQGCLLLSTRNNTPITRARPPYQPIGSLGNSTFPNGLGSDWLGDVSVKWASRKDAAGVLGTRSPEPRRSNLLINKMGPPRKRGIGVGNTSPAHPRGPTGVRAERRAGESLPLPPAPAAVVNTFPSMSVFLSLAVAITGCCLQKSFRAVLFPWDPVLHSPCLQMLFHAFSFSS